MGTSSSPHQRLGPKADGHGDQERDACMAPVVAKQEVI